MYQFSKRSASNLEECHQDLQLIFSEVIKSIDCTILQGHRGEIEQNQLFKEKKSKLKYPQSKHNSIPSLAVDCAPFPISWENEKAFYFLAGHVMAVSKMLLAQGKISHSIRFGGDWNSNNDLDDQTFQDLVHFELKI